MNVGPAGGTGGAPLGVLVAPTGGLPTSLRLPVSGQPPNQVATLRVADLLQLAAALQVYPSGLAGATPVAPTPPPDQAAITGLTASTERIPQGWRRDRFRLSIAWAGGPESATVTRSRYAGLPGRALAAGRLVRRDVLNSLPLSGGSGRSISYDYNPIRSDVLLSATRALRNGNALQFLALVDAPITHMTIPEGVSVPDITDGAKSVSIGAADWSAWEFTTLATSPAPSSGPRQVVIGLVRLAPGYRFGSPG